MRGNSVYMTSLSLALSSAASVFSSVKQRSGIVPVVPESRGIMKLNTITACPAWHSVSAQKSAERLESSVQEERIQLVHQACFLSSPPLHLVLLSSLVNAPLNVRPTCLLKLAIVLHHGSKFTPRYVPNRTVYRRSPCARTFIVFFVISPELETTQSVERIIPGHQQRKWPLHQQ